MWLLNRDRCTSSKCSFYGECVKVCPLQSLEMLDGFPRMKPDAECLLCSMCADTCPEGAIGLSIDKPASRDVGA